MKRWQSGCAVVALALLAGCGSGSGPTGNPIPAGPGPGENPGVGTTQESPGPGFDSPTHEPESSGPGLDDRGGAPGGPGGDNGGGGGSEREEFVAICKELCSRMAATCQVDRNECLAECDELPAPAAMPCGPELFAFMRCARDTRIICEDGEPLYEGCEDEGTAYVNCALGPGAGSGKPPN
mgnify:CR=1 FL=1